MPPSAIPASHRPAPSWLFFPLAFLLSWALWIPAALIGTSAQEMPVALLFFISGFGPSLAAVLLAYRRHDAAFRRDFWRRVYDFGRISPGWYPLIFLAVPLAAGGAYAIDALLGGGPYDAPSLRAALAQPLAFLPTLIILLLTGPLAEELGWRGYILDRLQARLSPLAAALLLGLVWWAWHLPLFFIVGTSHQTWGLWSADSAIFLLQIFPLSVLIHWAYNLNQRSTLAAVLIHFMVNLTFSLIYPAPLRVQLLVVALLALLAASLVTAAPGAGRGRVADSTPGA